VTAGRTLEEARNLAVEALAMHAEGMIEDGRALPAPSPLDAVQKVPEARGAVILLVDLADAIEPTVRVNITAPASKMRVVDEIALILSRSRSELLVDSALAHALADLEGWETHGTFSSRKGIPFCVSGDTTIENTPDGRKVGMWIWVYALDSTNRPTGPGLRWAATRRDAQQIAEEMAKSAGARRTKATG